MLSFYRVLERALLSLRTAAGKDDPEGADDILDELESMWEKLPEADRKQLKAEGASSWPKPEDREGRTSIRRRQKM